MTIQTTLLAVSRLKSPALAHNRLQPRVTLPDRSRLFRDFIIILSLANLSYLRVWSELLTSTPGDFFYLKHRFERSDYAAAIFGVLGIALAVWVVVELVRLYPGGALYSVCRLAFCLVAVIGPGLAIRAVVMHAKTPGQIFSLQQRNLNLAVNLFSSIDRLLLSRGSRPILFVLGAVLLWLAVRFLSRLVRLMSCCLVCASPLLIVTLAQASYMAATRNSGFIADRQTSSFISTSRAAHVVWIIFDEWDYRLAFAERDASLRLDALDRLRSEALFGTHTLPPAGETRMSLPSFIDGQRVRESIPEGPDTLTITYLDTGQTVPWGSKSNIFSKARSMGVNVGVLGWYLPYCRLFYASLAECSWVARAIPANTTGSTVPEKVVGQARSIFESLTFSPFGQSLTVRQHVRDYMLTDELVRNLATDERLGLVFAHMPAPHFPFVYDRNTDSFTRQNDRVIGYIDEMALVDRTVSRLRKALEETRQWDDTVILLTSDHPFRRSTELDGKSDPRVPFVLKMKGQRSGITLDMPFNNVVSGELVLGILAGRISAPDQVVGWLRQRATNGQLAE